MFRSLIRPLAELTRMWVPSQSNQTGVTWGEPSAITVARWASGFFCLRRSRYGPRRTAMFLSSSVSGSPSRRAEGRIQDALEIGHILDPDRQPDQTRTHAEPRPLLVRQRSVRRPGRIGP